MVDQKYFVSAAERRNAERRRLYAENPDHAENLRRARRQSYRRSHGEPLVSDPRSRVEQIARFGAVREVFDETGRSLGERLCCTVTEVCTVLGQRGKTVERWISSGRFPDAVYRTIPLHNQHPPRVFLSEEVVAVAYVLADHFVQVAVLRADHTETIERLQAAVDKVRKKP